MLHFTVFTCDRLFIPFGIANLYEQAQTTVSDLILIKLHGIWWISIKDVFSLSFAVYFLINIVPKLKFAIVKNIWRIVAKGLR